MTRVLIFGDDFGTAQLLGHLPTGHLVAIVAAGVRPQYHPVLRDFAEKEGVPFLVQPPNRDRPLADGFVSEVGNLHPDLFLVDSYSMKLSPELLDLPTLGALNIHGALLPRYRGSNPTQWAIINGETRTGVTLHEMSAEIDQGAIVAQAEVPLQFEDTWLDVRKRLQSAADALLDQHLPSLLDGTWRAAPQDEGAATITRRRTAADGQFRWDDPLIDIYNLVRALVAPLPGAFVEDGAERTSIDHFMPLPELLALKSSHMPLEYGGVTLRPIPPDEPASEPSSELWFAIDDPTGTALSGCIGGIDWARRTADVRVIASDGQSTGDRIGHATRGLVEFSARELGLSVVGKQRT